jgi:hypothetical protein
VLSCGLYRIVEMILSLRKKELLIFYRLSIWLLIGSMSGRSCFRRRNMRKWILGVPVWRWVHEISSIKMVGSFLDDYKMHRRLVLILFRWLIFMYILCDPLDVKLWTTKTCNRKLCASIDAKAAVIPVSKKKMTITGSRMSRWCVAPKRPTYFLYTA